MDNRRVSNVWVGVCGSLTGKWRVFMPSSVACQFPVISFLLSLSITSISPLFLPLTPVFHCDCPAVHLCVFVLVFFILSLCVFLRSHTTSRPCTQPQADRSGSGRREVGVGIDKAVNKVIGRINGDPEGTMSVSAWQSVSLAAGLSAWRGGGVRRSGETECVHKQNVIHNRAGRGLCCCSLPHPSIWQDNGPAWHNTEHRLPLWGQSKDEDTIRVLESIIHQLRPRTLLFCDNIVYVICINLFHFIY